MARFVPQSCTAFALPTRKRGSYLSGIKHESEVLRQRAAELIETSEELRAQSEALLLQLRRAIERDIDQRQEHRSRDQPKRQK